MPALLTAHRPIPASVSSSHTPARRRAAAPLAAGLALLAYGVIALALFPTVVAHMANAFAGDLGDPPSQAWILAWDVHALGTNPSHLYDANIFYPFHDVLAYQDTLLGLLPLAAPVLLLTGNLRRSRHVEPATARGPHAAEPLRPHPRVRGWGRSARRAQCLRGGQTTPTAVGSKAWAAVGPPIARRSSLRHRGTRGLPCDRHRRLAAAAGMPRGTPGSV